MFLFRSAWRFENSPRQSIWSVMAEYGNGTEGWVEILSFVHWKTGGESGCFDVMQITFHGDTIPSFWLPFATFLALLHSCCKAFLKWWSEALAVRWMRITLSASGDILLTLPQFPLLFSCQKYNLLCVALLLWMVHLRLWTTIQKSFGCYYIQEIWLITISYFVYIIIMFELLLLQKKRRDARYNRKYSSFKS